MNFRSFHVRTPDASSVRSVEAGSKIDIGFERFEVECCDFGLGGVKDGSVADLVGMMIKNN
jgi:hypothetical protein